MPKTGDTVGREWRWWCSVRGNRRVVSDPYTVFRFGCATLLRVAIVTCDLWLSVTHSYKMIHMDDSQVGMWVLCAELLLREEERVLWGSWEVGR